MHWDNETQAFEDRKGVQIRSPDFGSVRAMDYLNPSLPMRPFTKYFHDLIAELSRRGYRDGEDMFGAGYDWRKLPSPEWLAATRRLVEAAAARSGGRPVDLVAHSMGCLHAYSFLMGQTQRWKDRYIHNLIAVSPPWSGSVEAVLSILTGNSLGLPVDPHWARQLAVTFPGTYYLLPNPRFGWNSSQVLVKTPSKAYTANDYRELFADAGIEHAAPMSVRAQAAWDSMNLHGASGNQPLSLDYPGVPVSCIYSRGVTTAETLSYASGRFDGPPSIALGDGDGTVNLQSLEYACRAWQEAGHPVDISIFDSLNHFQTIMSPVVFKKIGATLCPD
eukprot:TRINITY_DN4495_c0_g1_i4.p1 TRINITY_DN4495_c0_g1~~TRINITY_DN4495_c0_g1_i4.p1  ORF type:complete len:333 (+),score=58.40 TRINITY_DN4495_c0_g1_i4:702-1700(+)